MLGHAALFALPVICTYILYRVIYFLLSVMPDNGFRRTLTSNSGKQYIIVGLAIISVYLLLKRFER